MNNQKPRVVKKQKDVYKRGNLFD